MENLSHTIVDQAVQAELQQGKNNIEGVTSGVKDRVGQTTATLREQFGDSVNELCADAMDQAETYAQSRSELLQGFDVEDLSQKGASGLCEMDAKRVVIDREQLEFGATPAEDDASLRSIELIAEHERRHLEQATQFDADHVLLDGEEITAENLYEGDAITAAGQTSEDLTPEYVEHKKKFDTVVSRVGKERVEETIKKGTLRELQLALAA